MFFFDDFLRDPINIIAVMAGLALVVSLTTALHYSLDRKAMMARMKNLEAAMNVSPLAPQDIEFRIGRERQVSAPGSHEDAVQAVMSEEEPNPFPQGMRFV